jgi:hypothetical protein
MALPAAGRGLSLLVAASEQRYLVPGSSGLSRCIVHRASRRGCILAQSREQTITLTG